MKKKLGTLGFEIEFRRSNELQNVGFPVEVRRPNLSLVKTGLTSEQMKLEPGEYFIISKMPAGQELFDHIEIKADKHSKAVLKVGEMEESPHESEALQHYLIADRQKVLSAIENLKMVGEDFEPALGISEEEIDLEGILPVIQLRVFSGNLLSKNVRQIQPDWQKRETEKGLLGFQIYGSNSIQIVQLVQTGAPPLNMILPAVLEHSCRLFVTSLVQGKYTLDTHLDNSTADIILRYSNKGYYQQTELIGQSIDAENLLMGKVKDQISAAVGAYALLRFNKLEELRDWTENLRNWFKWLPDGSAIRGEHLARIGRHNDALQAFLEIEGRGLPIFSDGLSYAIDRLSAYIELRSDFADESTFQKLKRLLLKLQKFAAYADFREPFTTFTGIDINEPSAVPVAEIAKDDKALDLTNLFI